MEKSMKNEHEENAVITDREIISDIIDELLHLQLSTLESVSDCFYFVREIKYEGVDEDENIFDNFTFYNIVMNLKEFYDIKDEQEIYLILRGIVCGLFAARDIPQVKSFFSISAESFAKSADNDIYERISYILKQHLDVDITPEDTVGKILGISKEILRYTTIPIAEYERYIQLNFAARHIAFYILLSTIIIESKR